MLKKIVIIGPESTGKSTLCEQLADHFQTTWVKEYAREYLEQKTTQYTFEDLYKISQGQIGNEDAALEETYKLSQKTSSPLPFFIDTDLYVIKVWSEFVYNKTDNRILKTIASRHYDFYLLCHPDLPWVADKLREYPDLRIREKLFHHYQDIMIQQSIPWFSISGNYEERLQKAIVAVNHIL